MDMSLRPNELSLKIVKAYDNVEVKICQPLLQYGPNMAMTWSQNMKLPWTQLIYSSKFQSLEVKLIQTGSNMALHGHKN